MIQLNTCIAIHKKGGSIIMNSINNKLVIVGVGNVGTAVLNTALSFGFASEIALIDIDNDKARGEALDSSHTTPCTYSVNVDIHEGNYEDCKDANVIIIAAGPSILKDDKNDDRTVLAERNVKVMKDVMGSISKYTKDAIIIIITNPLDTMVYYAENFFGYPKEKVFGTGTSLDSARFRKIIANRYNLDPKDVHGYMFGEHGNTAFPVWSHLNVEGVSADELDKFFPHDKPLDKEEIASDVVKVAYDVLHLKGCTNSGVAMAACRIARAVFMDEHSILPVSTTLEGEYGLKNVALSLPCIIGKNGVERRLEVSLTDEENDKLYNSAKNILATMKAAGLIEDK